MKTKNAMSLAGILLSYPMAAQAVSLVEELKAEQDFLGSLWLVILTGAFCGLVSASFRLQLKNDYVGSAVKKVLADTVIACIVSAVAFGICFLMNIHSVEALLCVVIASLFATAIFNASEEAIPSIFKWLLGRIGIDDTAEPPREREHNQNETNQEDK